MKANWIKRALSIVLASAMVICLLATAGVPAAVYAEESEGGGKYVSDVFISYGKSEEKAAKWLADNGWEPVKGDFNAGKGNAFNQIWDNTGIVAVTSYAASAFSGGQMALAGIGGLILGIAGATLVLNRKRREGKAEAA